MLDHWILILVGYHDLLDLLGRVHGVRPNLFTCLNMIEKCLIPLSGPTARAAEIDQLQNFLDTSMHLSWSLSAPAILHGTAPAALHLDTLLAVERITGGAL